MVTLAALDPLLVRKCPRAERLAALYLAFVVVGNGAVISGAIFSFLYFVGHELYYVLPLSLAGGIWFVNLQRFLLLLHGERRRRWSQFYSRMVCSLFMGFFAVLSFLSLYNFFTHTQVYRSLFESNTVLLLTALTSHFILPVYLRRRFFQGSIYAELEQRVRSAAITRWNDEFSALYIKYVRCDLKLSEYVMPDAMLYKDI